MQETAIAVHACGFSTSQGLCRITYDRLGNAMGISGKTDIKNFIVSGGPPYNKGKAPLAYLMRDYLKKFSLKYHIYCATDCFNSSTDIQTILSIMREQNFNKLYAVSSFWHLWVLKPIYHYWIKKLNCNIDIKMCKVNNRSVKAGLKTVFTYFIYALLIKLSILFGVFSILDATINKLQSKRLNGYPISGCA